MGLSQSCSYSSWGLPLFQPTQTHAIQNYNGFTRPCQHPLNPSYRLVIEDVKGPEVTLRILSDSLLQVTLRSKLYLSLQE